MRKVQMGTSRWTRSSPSFELASSPLSPSIADMPTLRCVLQRTAYSSRDRRSLPRCIPDRRSEWTSDMCASRSS